MDSARWVTLGLQEGKSSLRQLHLSLDLKRLENVERGSNWQDKSPIRQKKRGQMEEMGLSGELLILLDKKKGGNVGSISLVGHRWSQQEVENSS